MKSFVRTIYTGEDRELTLDWILSNPCDENCLSVRIRDDQLLHAKILETHGIECIDTILGVAIVNGIAPNGVRHVSARIVPTGTSLACEAGLIYANVCMILHNGE